MLLILPIFGVLSVVYGGLLRIDNGTLGSIIYVLLMHSVMIGKIPFLYFMPSSYILLFVSLKAGSQYDAVSLKAGSQYDARLALHTLHCVRHILNHSA